MIRKVTKIFAWLIGGVASFAIIVYLLLLGINWRDASPSEEAVHFAQQYANRPHVSDEKNGFVFMVGMSVVPTGEPMQAGLAMIERARTEGPVDKITEYSHPSYPLLDLKKERTKEMNDLFETCSSTDEKCLTLLQTKSVTGIQPGTSDALLLKRYRSLITFTEWQDIYPQTPESPLLPQFTPALEGQLLTLFDIWQHAESRDVKMTIAMLDGDAAFWRRVLSGSDSLITSEVASRALSNNLLWTNLVLRRMSTKQAIPVPPVWLHPFSDEERLMKQAWVGEWAMNTPMYLRYLPEKIKKREASSCSVSFGECLLMRLAQPFYQPQDTVNLYTQYLSAYINQYDVPYEQLPAVVERQRALSGEKPEDKAMRFPRILYNPLGKSSEINMLDPAYGSSMLLVSDLEGCRRALLATYQLRIEKIRHDKINEALTSSEYHNPYTNHSFTWDESTGNVVFDGLGPRPRKQKHYIFPL